MQVVTVSHVMVPGILAWLRSLFGSEDDDRDDESEATRDESDAGGFAPSVLDASVRYAHGDSGTGLEGELASLEEEAERLEAERED